ncbi:MAG: terpene cyclase/mutase family protein [Kiritimatiellaeota bacterium]|nr:terpene cyclase/mutase family protein [Kiritimatiellota bacterium]
MKPTLKTAIAIAATAALSGAAAAEPINPELARKARAATEKGAAWLKAQQKESGAWSEENMPALTALPLWALAASGLPDAADAQKKAVDSILAKQQPDGGFYVMQERQGGGLGNYNTAVCVTALHATGRKDLAPAILKARAYIASSQLTGETPHAGGFGYDKNAPRAYTDLNNTSFALDAMRRTQSVEDLRPAGEKRVDVDWDAALKYVEQLQSKEGDAQGGFAYNKETPQGQGGAAANPDGAVMLRAYGSMTYAGVLSLVHAQLDKRDPRVRAAFDYATRFWTVDENPGQGQQGLYFYFNIMARALTATGTDTLPKDTGAIPWREELIAKVLSLQKPDGSWANDNNRWWENDPVLATSYAILAIQFAAGATK